jgi:putative phage-type endonuclease
MIDQSKRRYGLGGSDVPVIFGADPYGRTQFDLWLQRTGQVEPTPPSLQMRLGKKVEAPLMDLYREETGRNVEPMFDRTFIHPERPFQIATPDGLIVDEQRGVEIKMVFHDFAHAWGDPPYEVPDWVELQTWHYMAFYGYPAWDVYACVEGDLRLYTVERDPKNEAIMLEREREWVERYLIRGEHPPLEHSEAANRWLLKTYPTHKRPDLRPAEPDEIKLLDEYVDLRIKEKLAERRTDELETLLKLAIADREGLEWEDGRFTWRTRKGRTSTNWEAIARGLKEYVSEEDWNTLLGLQTRTAGPTRAIGLVSDRYKEAVKEGAEVAS